MSHVELTHTIYRMNKTHTEIIVAARGWSHPDWRKNFYPEDLPEDWQLSFYSNEFRAVVVPESVWFAGGALEAERWVEDTNEDFVFYLELADLLADWARLTKVAQALGDRLGGILLRPAELDADLAMLSSCLDAVEAVAPVCLLVPPNVKLSEIGRDLLKQHGVSPCWNTDQGEPDWTQGGFAVARAAGNIAYTPRHWREIIERCLRCEIQGGGKRKVLLMVEQESPDIDALRAAMMIGDMLVIPDIE